jgi:CzcA family heavy metal efflux pump
MLDRIIQFSLRNRLFVVAAAALVMVYGVYVLMSLPVDVLPDVNRPTVTIMTEAEGYAPEEVEPLITQPMETALNGAPGVERVRSVSGVGLSIIYVEFGWNTDIYRDRQLVSERLQSVTATMPSGVVPQLGPVSSVMGEIMLIGLSSEEISPMDLRTVADFTLRRKLLTVPGVAQVIPIGGGVKQYQVLVNNNALQSYGLSIADVEKAVGQSNVNTTGGYLDKGGQEYLIRNIARTASTEDIANTVVRANKSGPPVLVRNVAQIVYGSQVKRGDASIDGKPAVILSIEKQPGANTLDLTKQIDVTLDELQRTLPKGVHLQRDVFRQSHFIESSIQNVIDALRDGAILVTIVLFLFLLNFRTTAITLTAIPLSFVVTAIVFHFFGVSINTMTLGGLAVAIGELVDDAIVDVENVFRRLRENAKLGNPVPSLTVVYRASKEVRNSIVYATILVVLVFIPLFSLSGIEGKIFVPLGIAYITSILASLVVSLTVTPALASYLLSHFKFADNEKESFVVRWLKKQDTGILHYTLEHPKKVMGAVAVLFILALATVPFLGSEFLPPFNEGSLTINLIATPGTSLSASDSLGTFAERQMLQVPEVKSVGRRTGRAEMDEHAEGTHSSEIEVELRPSKRDREEVLHDIRDRLALIPGVVINIGQPISHRLDHLLSGVRAQIAVKLFGNDLPVLRSKAAEIQAAMLTVPGAVDISIEKQTLIPQIPITINREAAARYGLQAGEIVDFLQTALNGKVVSQVLQGQMTFAIIVRSDSLSRADPIDMGNLFMPTPTGGVVPLREVATVEVGKGPNAINHENAQRRIIVQANVAGRSLGSVVSDMQKAIQQKVTLPQGYSIIYGGQFESQQSASRLIAILSLFSLAAMFAVLFAHFSSARIVLQILLNIPLALIGSVLAILLTSRTISIASLVGFITLTGIASRNGIMMISHYIHLVTEEGEEFSKHMIIRGSLERLVPVLMTALTAGLALVPLVLAKGEPGKEILYPVAVVILGGLISSTLLDILITPTVFFTFGKPALDKYILKNKAKSLELTSGDEPAPASNLNLIS